MPLNYKGFNPANGMTEALREYWTENSRCLLISAFPDEYELDDRMRDDYEHIVRDTGLSISCMDICDLRNGKEKADELTTYDFVILGGGHVPTQQKFFSKIGLREKLSVCSGVVVGISAGSMNGADTVYAQPERSGEATDPAYRRFLPGLGLTKTVLLPHYDLVKDDVLDGQRLYEDITCGDSFGRTFYAIPDGSYLYGHNGMEELWGEAHRIRDGVITQVGFPDTVLRL